MSLVCRDVCVVMKSKRMSVQCQRRDNTMCPSGFTGSRLQYVYCLLLGKHARHKPVHAKTILVNALNVQTVHLCPRYVCAGAENSLQDGFFHLYQPLLGSRHCCWTEQQVVECCNYELVRRSGLRAQGRVVLAGNDRRAGTQLCAQF